MKQAKISIVGLDHATVRVSNQNDENRTFDVEARAIVNGGVVTALQEGVVRDIESGIRKAQFSEQEMTGKSIVYDTVSAEDEQIDILKEVNAVSRVAKSMVVEALGGLTSPIQAGTATEQ